MDSALAGKLLGNFLTALGVTIGGSLSGAAASLLLGGHPMDRLRFLSDEMRLWGILVAVSGSFEPLRGMSEGLFGGGDWRVMGRQVLYILAAMFGAHVGYLLLQKVAGTRP